tara:strand:+ start:81 stop:947 length:867 start_codon:yes stop_codon:yes gene_type:complete
MNLATSLIGNRIEPLDYGVMLAESEPSTIFPELNDVLRQYAERVKSALSENLVGVYLAGSFAVGDADAYSDVDLMVITEREITESQLAHLQALHGELYDLDSEWAQHLEISYMPCALLNDQASVGITKLWYLDNGQRSLQLRTHDNSWVVRWVLRDCGIPLIGPAAITLINPIPENLLKDNLCAVVRTWGGDIVADPNLMDARWYQAFVVMTWCRILMSLETGRIYSKPASARWAQQTLGERWAVLIEKTLNERPIPWEIKVYESAKPEVLKETLEFTRYVLKRVGKV